MAKTELNVQGIKDHIDIFNANLIYKQYLAVRTKDDRNKAEKVYTQRAFARWSADVSGELKPIRVYTPFPDSGVAGMAFFINITDGDKVPVTTGTTLNTLLETKKWIEVPIE